MPLVLPATSDMLTVRNQGIPAFGFSTLINTPFLAHSNNEQVNVKTFLEGIDIYEALITKLANLN